jgi:hypothetical protein
VNHVQLKFMGQLVAPTLRRYPTGRVELFSLRLDDKVEAGQEGVFVETTVQEILEEVLSGEIEF